MIPVEYYVQVYYLILSVCITLMFLPLFKYENINLFSNSTLNFNTTILLSLTICFIGFRDPLGSPIYLGDTFTYTMIFNEFVNGVEYGAIPDPGFNLLMKFCSKYLNIRLFYIICALLYVLPSFFAFKKWFGQNAFFALAIFIVSMSFWNFGVNGVRNGISTSFVIYAFSLEQKKLKTILVFLLAISFHKTAILPILAYLITLKFSNTKMLIRTWLFAVIFSYFFGEVIENFIQQFISLNDFTNNKNTQNLFVDEINNQEVRRGFRVDFIIYSGFAILMGYVYTVKMKVNNIIYFRLLNTYLIANIVWVFFIYAAYTNRIAYLSWFLMPVVLIFPLLKEKIYKKQNNVIAYMILGSLAFNLLLFSR